MHSDLDAVTASYQRCRASGDFAETFYQRFLAKSPDVADKFRHTDFPHQKLMLRQSLLQMLMFNRNSAEAKKELERLAEHHSRRGLDIAPRLYDLWLEALCEAVAEHDPLFNDFLKEHWTSAMQAGIDLLVSKY